MGKGITFGNKEVSGSLKKSVVLRDELMSHVSKMSDWEFMWLLAYCVGRLQVASGKSSDSIYKDLIYQAKLIKQGK
jgi:hypothetical protein